MPTKSSYKDVDIPALDLWGFMFEQERDFPDDRGGNCAMLILPASELTFHRSNIPRCQLRKNIYLEVNQRSSDRLRRRHLESVGLGER